MSEAFFTLGGVALGGLITLAVSFLRQSHEERMAQTAHERQETAHLNQEVAGALVEQLEVGTRMATFVARAKMLFSRTSTAEERTQALENALSFVGIDLNAPEPSIKPPEFYEDSELRELISEHAGLIQKANTYAVRGDYEPDTIPETEFDFWNKMHALRTKIELRARALRRAGKPL